MCYTGRVMKTHITPNDRFLSTSQMMGGATVVDSISLDDLFNWELASEPVFDARGHEIPKAANIVNAGGESLSIMGDVHALLQPRAFVDMIGTSLEGLNYKIAFAASMANQANYIVGVEIIGYNEFSINGEPHRQFQLYSYGASGEIAMVTAPMFERVICSNQFSMMLAGNKACGKAKNTAGGQVRYASMTQELADLLKLREQFSGKCDRLGNTLMQYDGARAFVAGLLATAGADKLSTRSQNLIRQVVDKFENGKGCHGKTRYDMFNAFTEHYTHDTANPSAKSFKLKGDPRFGSSLAGRPAEIKRAALHALSHDEAFEKTIRRGRVLIDTIE